MGNILVCSVDYAKRLHSVGCIQTSAFYWVDGKLCAWDSLPEAYSEIYSAYTVYELSVMLGSMYYWIKYLVNTGLWYISGSMGGETFDSQANANAEALLRFIHDSKLKIEDINNRFKKYIDGKL